jgi:hypothetical protein
MKRPVLDRVPDFRSSLYWDPSIITNEQGEATIIFHTADNAGEFRIQFDGITANGQPVSATKTIQVRFRKASAD